MYDWHNLEWDSVWRHGECNISTISFIFKFFSPRPFIFPWISVHDLQNYCTPCYSFDQYARLPTQCLPEVLSCSVSYDIFITFITCLITCSLTLQRQLECGFVLNAKEAETWKWGVSVEHWQDCVFFLTLCNFLQVYNYLYRTVHDLTVGGGQCDTTKHIHTYWHSDRQKGTSNIQAHACIFTASSNRNDDTDIISGTPPHPEIWQKFVKC